MSLTFFISLPSFFFFCETHLLITIYIKTFILVCVIPSSFFFFIILSMFPFSFMFVLSITSTTTTTTSISTTKTKQNNNLCYRNPTTEPGKRQIDSTELKTTNHIKTLIFLEWMDLPDPSAPPQEVTCFSSSSTSILVSWKPPPVELQNGFITKYTIQYAATEGEDTSLQEIKEILPEKSRYLLENLEKWTEYRVTVTAHTDVGAGPESLPQLIRTEEDGMFCQKRCAFLLICPPHP